MDKIQHYRQLIREFLTEQAHPYIYSEDVEPTIICDTENDHYQLAYIGWRGQKRVFGIILHFDIRDGKIWIQYNGTEIQISQVLVEKEVPKSDIVLGFHSSFKRQFSGYAVA